MCERISLVNRRLGYETLENGFPPDFTTTRPPYIVKKVKRYSFASIILLFCFFLFDIYLISFFKYILIYIKIILQVKK